MELVLTSIHARYSKQLDCTTQGGGMSNRAGNAEAAGCAMRTKSCQVPVSLRLNHSSAQDDTTRQAVAHPRLDAQGERRLLA